MVPVLRHRNTILEVDNGALVDSAYAETYLTAEAASGGSTITVKNIDNFAVNQVVLFGELGDENSEIIKTHASSAPSGTTVTLASNLVRTHAVGTRVRVIPYDQIEFSHAATETGSKSVLATVSIQPGSVLQRYEETAQTSGFYFARYKDSIATEFSSYTDALAYSGWASNTVGYMIETALDLLDVSLSEKLTKEFCHKAINSGLSYVQGKIRRFPKHMSENAIIGQAQRGANTVTLPTDTYDKSSNKSIFGVRIGDGPNLQYLNQSDFEEAKRDSKQTQVRTQATSGATTLEVDNSYDFADSGSIIVFISGVRYAITYTGVTRDNASGGTALFSGIPASGDGSISVTIPVDTNVWQDEEEGEPLVYTVRNGEIEYWPLVDASHDNANVYSDYSKVATAVDSSGDTIDYERFDMILDYLTWRIKMHVRNDGELNQSDGYFLQFKEKLNDTIRTLIPRRGKMIPRINRVQQKRHQRKVKYSDQTT